jgi:hypothetical protein
MTLGNCGSWVSNGLCAGGILNRQASFPKEVFCDLLEKEHAKDPKNVNVVFYKHATHAK